jgi:hypothetical protein
MKRIAEGAMYGKERAERGAGREKIHLKRGDVG